MSQLDYDSTSYAAGAAGPSVRLPRRAGVWCAWGLVALFTYFTVYDFHRLSQQPPRLGDFPTYYEAARAMTEGRDPYALRAQHYYVYPPLFAFLVTPLTRLSVVGAARVFLAVNLACMAASLLLASRAVLERMTGLPDGTGTEGAFPRRPLPRGAVAAVALLTALLTENTIRGGLQSHETDVLMLFLFTVAFYWLDRRPVWAGGALAFAFNIKYLSIAFLPWLLLRRRWSAAGGFAGGVVAFALLPAVLVGWREDLRCLRAAVSGPMGWSKPPPLTVGTLAPSAPGIAAAPAPSAAGAGGGESAHGPAEARAAHVLPVTDMISMSVTSMVARYVHRAGAKSLWPAFAIAAGLGAGCVGLAVWMYRRRGLPCFVWPAAAGQGRQPFRWVVAVEWAGLLAFVLAFSPDTNMRHIILVVPLNAAAAAVLLFGAGRAARPLLLAGTALLCVALLLPWKGVMSHAFFMGWYGNAVPTWCLLVMYASLLWVGLGLAAAGRGQRAGAAAVDQEAGGTAGKPTGRQSLEAVATQPSS